MDQKCVGYAWEKDADTLVGYFEEMAEVIRSNKDDCDKLGDALEKFAAKNGVEMKALTEKMNSLSGAQMRELEEMYKDRMRGIEKRLDEVSECVSNEKVMRALEAIM